MTRHPRRMRDPPTAVQRPTPSPVAEVTGWINRWCAQAALIYLISPSSAQEETITMTTSTASTANNTLLDGKTTERLDAMEREIRSLVERYGVQLGHWGQRMRELEGRVEELAQLAHRVEELEATRSGAKRRAHRALDEDIVAYLRDVEHGRWTSPQVLSINLNDGRTLSGGAAADRMSRLARDGRIDRLGGTGQGSRPLYRVRPQEMGDQ